MSHSAHTAVQLESADVTQSSSDHAVTVVPAKRTVIPASTKSSEKSVKVDQLQALSGRRYRLLEVIGKGGFGMVFRAELHQEGSAPLLYALKSERPDHVAMESAVLSGVAEHLHFCKLIDRGIVDEKERHFIVMTLIGPSLSMLRDDAPSRQFSLSTAIRVSMQMLFAIEQLHGAGFVSRDIKPSNYAVGAYHESRRVTYMLDFGISRRYRDDNGNILPPTRVIYRGTTRYCSINSHKGVDQSRRDDVESWFYSLMELTLGRLPWSHIPKVRKDKVCREKQLARGLRRSGFLGGCPREYHSILDAIDFWNYYSDPDYMGIYVYLTRVTKRMGFEFDDPYDWETMPAFERYCETVTKPPGTGTTQEASLKSQSVER
ncbi:Protein kinase domain containing protein [Aphelenchoides avenae]|nr:Protein kinase domain containing protein [Aphelenchus avenae]